MPFTLAHPAAVLPLLRSPFVPVALIAGSMAPDAPYFLTTAGLTSTHAGDWYGAFLNATTTHSLSGAPVDLFYTAVLIATYWLLRAPITALGVTLPRIGRPNPLWLVVSATMGVATHLLWDYVTDAARFLQYLSTGVGLIAVGWFVWKHRAALRAPDASTPQLTQTTRRVVLAVLIGIPLLAAAVLAPVDLADYTAAGSSAAGIAEGVATGAVKRAGAAFTLALLLYAVASWTTTWSRRPS